MKKQRVFLLLVLSFFTGKLFSQTIESFEETAKKSNAILFEDTALKVKPKLADRKVYDKWIKDNNKKYQDFSQIAMGEPISVTVAILLDEQGNIVASAISKSVGFGFDEEALRLIKENPNRWNPGMLKGKPVPVELRYQIDFINNSNFFATKNNKKIFKQY
ncbi:MAG: energy transducer TonB [Bacteroidota bacterium]|nr:energy transducer TonB [Bacteroidota bacterium]